MRKLLFTYKPYATTLTNLCFSSQFSILPEAFAAKVPLVRSIELFFIYLVAVIYVITAFYYAIFAYSAINCYLSYQFIYKINLILIIDKQQTTNATSWTVQSWLVAWVSYPSCSL